MWSFRPTRRGVVMGGLAIGVGFGLGYLVDRPAWWDADAILDADFANARFRWDNQTFGDEAAFLAAIGGVGAGGFRSIGPYVAPGAPELVVNGTFDTDLSGWTSAIDGAGSSAAIVSQSARLVSDGTAGTGGKGGGAGIYQALPTVPDRAYRLRFTNSGPNSLSLRAGSGIYLSNSYSAGVRAPAGAPYIEAFNADGETTYFYAFRSAAGECNLDGVSVQECLPFKNYDPAGVTIEIEATAPAVPTSKALFGLYSTGPNDEANIRLNGSNQLIVQMNYAAGTVAQLNLGTITAGQSFKVRAGWKTNAFYAQLNDGPILADTLGTVPGFGFMRIGSDSQGTVWDGAISRIKLWACGGIGQFVGEIDNAIHAEGDSFMGGAYGAILPSTLGAAMGRTVYNTGAGGNTMDQISARLIAAPAEIRAKTTVIWDGDQNGMTTVGEYCDLLAAGIAALGHNRFVLIPPCLNFGQSDLSAEAEIRDEFVARWPNNVFDWRSALTLDEDGVPVSSMYHDSATDATHLSQAALDLVAPAVAAFIEAKGW